MNSGVPVLLFNNVFNFKSISTHNSVISFCFPWKNILYCSLSVLTSSNALLYLQRLLLHSHTFKESAFCDSPMGFPHSSVGKKSTCNAGDPGLIPGLGRSTGEGISYSLQYSWASLVAQLYCLRETWGSSLGWENPLEKEKLPTPLFWLGESHGLYSLLACKESDTTERLSLSTKLADRERKIGEDHPSLNVQHITVVQKYIRQLVMDREAWHAAVRGVAKSRTWLSGWTDWTEKYIHKFFYTPSFKK